MPFVSNRMNSTNVDARVHYDIPKVRNLIGHAGTSRVIAGRNVGQATTVTAGLLIPGNL